MTIFWSELSYLGEEVTNWGEWSDSGEKGITSTRFLPVIQIFRNLLNLLKHCSFPYIQSMIFPANIWRKKTISEMVRNTHWHWQLLPPKQWQVCQQPSLSATFSKTQFGNWLSCISHEPQREIFDLYRKLVFTTLAKVDNSIACAENFFRP